MATDQPGRRVKLERSPEDRAREEAIREQYRHRPSLETLLSSGEYEGPVRHSDYLDFLRFLGSLRSERERLGLSLAEVSARSGIDQPALSRLENGQNANPTAATLMRFASALGKRIVWSVEEVVEA